jgi:hypothetical protein
LNERDKSLWPTPQGKVTPRTAKFWKYLLENGLDESKLGQCVEAAGFNNKNPRSYAKKLLDNPVVNALFNEEMEHQHLTVPALVSKMVELLQAKKESKFEDAEPVPDGRLQKDVLRMALELRNAFLDPKLVIEKKEEHFYQFDFDTLRRAEIVTGEQIIEVIPEPEELDEDLESPL